MGAQSSVSGATRGTRILIGSMAALLAALALSLSLSGAARAAGVFAWGQGASGQLANGLEADVYLPGAIGGLPTVSAVAAGNDDSYALSSEGTVWASGANSYGQLGDATASGPQSCAGKPCSRTPVEVAGLGGVAAIAGSGGGAVALTNSGHVMAWGAAQWGQLGNGQSTGPEICSEGHPATACATTPVEVSSLSEVVAVASSGSFSLALLKNGHVMAWGSNSAGALGNGGVSEACGAVACSRVPVEVSGLSGVKAIAAGNLFGLALLENGHVMVWGNSALGYEKGKSINSNVPVEQPGLSAVTAISASGQFALAAGAGGTVSQWRMEVEGERTPKTLAGVSGAVALAATTGGGLALLEDGEVESWGSDEHGQLGYGWGGQFASASTPAGVCGLRDVTSLAAGGFHALALVPGPESTAPIVMSLSHRYGPKSGSEAVVLEGRHLSEATAVHFGAASVSFKVISDTAVEAQAPAGSEETFPTVSTPAGTSFTCGGAAYLPINPPYVQKVDTKAAPATGGVTFTLEGGLFAEVAAVYFGSTPASSFTFNEKQFTPLDNYGKLKVVSPVTTAGKVAITVLAAGGLSTPVKKATVKIEPVITGLSPAAGPLAGGPVTVHGVGFATGSSAESFKFGSSKAKIYSCPSATECTVQAPARTSPGAVALKMTVNKVAATSSPTYTYE